MYKSINSLSFVKLIAVIKSQDQVTELIKSAILSLFRVTSVNEMLQKYQTLLGQIMNVSP